MSGFHDVEFPLSLAFGASGGPQRFTQITPLTNGAEQRNTPHAHSKRRYNAGAGIKSLDDLHTLIAFFEARRGQLYSFRFKDPTDFKSCRPSHAISALDQSLGLGDGVQTQFQLVKTYSDALGHYVRPIKTPVENSVRVAVNGVEVGFEAEPITGRVTLEIAPEQDAVITAGFEFHVPVRFDSDALDLTLEAFGAGEAAHIPLIEVRDYESV